MFLFGPCRSCCPCVTAGGNARRGRDNAGEDRHLQYSQILSELQDLDYTEALTQLSQQQFTLEAAQRSFMAVSGLSLFKFL